MKKLMVVILCGALLGLGGCHWVTLTKDNSSWHASELSLMSDSTLANLVCTVGTNGFALAIGAITTGVSTNASPLVEATGKAVGNVINTAVTGD